MKREVKNKQKIGLRRIRIIQGTKENVLKFLNGFSYRDTRKICICEARLRSYKKRNEKKTRKISWKLKYINITAKINNSIESL